MTSVRALAIAIAATALSCAAFAMTGGSDNPLERWSPEQWTSAERRLAHFNLFTDCQPIALSVRYFNRPANGVELSEAALRSAITDRLRDAQAHSDADNLPYRLMVRVTVYGPAFNVHVEFAKWLHDPLKSKEWGVAETWQGIIHGMHGNSADFIVADVLRIVEDFLIAFRRVNVQACAKGKP